MASKSEIISNSSQTGQEIVAKNVEHFPISAAKVIQQVPVGKQVLPLVYIQTPKNTNSSNVIINPVSSLQLQNLTPIQAKPAANLPTQSLLLGKQPIALQKAPTKIGVTYLTMLKPVSKPPDNILASSKVTTLSKLKTEAVQKKYVPSTQSQSKIMIAPMPKVTTNRLPVTATTNSVQSKISFMPVANTTTTPIFCNIEIPEVLSDKGGDFGEAATNDNGKHAETTTMTTVSSCSVGDSNTNSDSNVQTQTKTAVDIDKIPKFVPLQPGVSILKRSYSSSENKQSLEAPLDTIATNVTDPVAEEKKAAAVEALKKPDPPPVVTQKRSRKSTLCLRKDFHEIETIEEGPRKKVPKVEKVVFGGEKVVFEEKVEKKVADEKKVVDEKSADMEVDYINSLSDWTFTFDENFADLLVWDDGIGSLPESDLKFFINEFGFLEYLTKYEYRRMTYKKQLKQVKETIKREDQQQEMRCLNCGCFGMSSEFINPKFCSQVCQGLYEKKGKRVVETLWKKEPQNNNTQSTTNANNNKKKLLVENGEIKSEVSDEDNQVDNLKHPWDCKRGFSWPKYISHVNAVSAPERLFKDPFPYNRNGFRVGMKLEGIDPQHPSHFCALTVAMVQGYRLRLNYDGFPPNYDFWVNADSMDIFPVGSCEKQGRKLKPPPKIKNWNWNNYLKYTRTTAAGKQLFPNRSGHAIFPSGFRIGMKLEAVDRRHSSLICVATIKDLMDHRLLVHFDGWDDVYDYWADPSSPYIHPVGWCEKNKQKLTPPSDYPDASCFSWEKYLEETGAQAAPTRAFKQRPASGFKRGMRLECVDKRVPQLIRVATVDDVVDHRLRISFDGWPDKYSYFVDDDSPDIHPPGWCQKTGHPLEPPLTPEDVYDSQGCPTIGCKGLGNTEGAIFDKHSLLKYCPYAEENLDLINEIPDRFSCTDKGRYVELPADRDRVRKKNKELTIRKYETDVTKTEWIEDQQQQSDDEGSKPSISSIGIISTHKRPKSTIATMATFREILEEVDLDSKKMREKHSRYLEDLINFNEISPRRWSCFEVGKFVCSLPFIKVKTDLFVAHRIDGESFLMLTQQDLTEVLNFKLGPAIALYNCILLLRKRISDCS